MKVLKIITFWIAVGLIIFVTSIAGLFLGHPIGYLNAWIKTATYINQQYPNNDYQIKLKGYVFKHGDYVVEVSSPSKVDEYFTLWISDFGTRIRTHTIDFHRNTNIRLNGEYQEYIEQKGFWESLDFEVKYHYASMLFFPSDYEGIYVPHENAIVKEALEINKTYDIEEMALSQGDITISSSVKEPTFEMIATILLETKKVAEEQGVPFYTINVHLDEKDVYSSDPVVEVVYFRNEDIYEEGLVERVEENFERYRKAKEEAGLGERI